MNKNMMRAAVMVTSLVLAGNVFGQDPSTHLAFDQASNYVNWGGDPSLNEGFGFAPWTFDQATPDSGFAGRFIGSTATGDPSFGLFSGNNAGAFSSAFRAFDNPLTAGDTFSVDIGHTPTINGEVGLNLINNGTIVFTLKFVGGGENWSINDGGADFGAGQAYAANTSLTFSFTYNGGNSYSYTFGSGSGNNFTATSDISSINEVGFYSVNQGTDQNFGINNLAVIPESSSIIMMGLAGLAAGGLTVLKRRKQS